MRTLTPEDDANVRTDPSSVKRKDEDASTASAPVKAEQEVKEEIESGSGGSRAVMPAQTSQASSSGNGRPYEPENSDPNRDTQENLLGVPWIDVMNELRSVRHSCRQLRTQVENVASNTDLSEIVARQDALTTRLEQIEAGLSTVKQDQNHAAETAREYQTKVDLCKARIKRVNNRIRTQE